jgi:hypothetical protein
VLQVQRLQEAAHIQRLPAELGNEPGHHGLGCRVVAAEQHRALDVRAREAVVFEVLEALDRESLDDVSPQRQSPHFGGARLSAFEPVGQPGADGLGAIHQHFAGERRGPRRQHCGMGVMVTQVARDHALNRLRQRRDQVGLLGQRQEQLDW